MTEYLPSTTGERITELREGADLTIEELAAKIGINATTLGRMEKGQTQKDSLSFLVPKKQAHLLFQLGGQLHRFLFFCCYWITLPPYTVYKHIHRCGGYTPESCLYRSFRGGHSIAYSGSDC